MPFGAALKTFRLITVASLISQNPFGGLFVAEGDIRAVDAR